MTRIVITQPVGLTDTQLDELKALGDVTYYDTVSKDTAEWVERVKGADVIYTNNEGVVEGYKSVRDAFITLRFVGVGFLDPAIVRQNNLVISNSPGCNQVAVSEWVVAMLLNYARRFPDFINATHFDEPTPIFTTSLYGKRVCIMGKGNIGARVGKILETLGMDVDYYTRHDDLAAKIKDADFIVDCLSVNPSTVDFYNDAFFEKTKHGVVFVSVNSNRTKDLDVVLGQIASGKIKHFISDNAQGYNCDVDEADYKRVLDNSKVTITPHVAAYSDNTRETTARMCIDNIKAYLAGKPINLVGE